LCFAASVVDQNDHSPKFSQEVYAATIIENSPPSQPLLRVTAFDLDDGINAELTYRLQDDPDELLNVDKRLGIVSNAAAIDFEAASTLTATVVATDGGSPARSASAAIVVKVVNVDDEHLTFSVPHYGFTVAENQPAGTLVGHVSAVDADLRPTERRVRYGLAVNQDSRMFYVVESSGAVLTNASLDFERRRNHRLVVTAVDFLHPGFTAACDVTVTVGDVNDHRPRFVFPSPGSVDRVALEVDGRHPINVVVCTLKARDDDDNDNGRLTFSLVSDHDADLVSFNLDPVSGQLRLVAEQLSVSVCNPLQCSKL